MVHRLVAEAFIENSNKLLFVNHKDENKQNNMVDNLEWCNEKYNSNYGTAIQRSSLNRRNDTSRSKKVAQLDLNDNIITIYPSLNEAKRCGYNLGAISACCRGKYNKYKGYKWKFVYD